MAINFLVSLLKKNWNNVPWGNYPRDSMIDGVQGTAKNMGCPKLGKPKILEGCTIRTTHVMRDCSL
jgi:hypothetical protein